MEKNKVIKENKDLLLVCDYLEFVDKDTKEVKRYRKLVVDINGVKVVVEPRKTDYTGKALINKYFDDLEKI